MEAKNLPHGRTLATTMHKIIILFLKSHHLGKCSHLTFLYIVGYNNISWRPHATPRPQPLPSPKSGGCDSYPPGLTPMQSMVHVRQNTSDLVLVFVVKSRI